MGDADRTLRRVRQATIHLRATQGRSGNVVHIPPTDEVMVVGDLHGNVANFKAVLERAGLAEHPQRHLVLQELVHGEGRYPAGGDTSHQLLDLAAAIKCRYPHRVHLLLGNHELSEWTGRSIGKMGIELNDLFARGVAVAYGDRAGEVLDAYAGLYAAMLLGVRIGRVFACHSIPPAKVLPDFDFEIFEKPGIAELDASKTGSLYWLVWGRDVSERTAAEFCRRVDADWLVTGHIACAEGFATPNSRQVILDCVARPAAWLMLRPGPIPTIEALLGGIGLLE